MSDTVLVTGSSRGIGKAIAMRLAKDDYDLVLHCRSNRKQADDLLAQIKKLGREARVLQFDLTDRGQCRGILEADIRKFGPYYGVVCNAGIVRDNAFPAISGEDWDQVLRTNLDGFYNVLHPIIMPMIRRRKPGRIVTLSSISGEMGNRGQVNYSASKAGIIGATKALAVELGKRKITVNCVAPGWIDTEMAEPAFGGGEKEAIAQSIPIGRIPPPEDIAGPIVFLCSDLARHITGEILNVNGGAVLAG